MLTVIHARELHHMVPDRAMRTIGANHEVERYLYLFWVGLAEDAFLDPGFPRLEVGADEFVAEEELYVGHRFERVEKGGVEGSAVARKVCPSVDVIVLAFLEQSA